MLQLKNITKSYPVAGGEVQALKGVSINFRKNEFVSILGASGCGKTTLLNIIGGLDKYTSGDLVIQGTSTKEYKNRDWDTYRNHSIGFIFQSYHLIPHQTILQNVELALTISGISKAERRARAMEALKKVGLDEKLNVRPNQLSGGQAQRVAIARALINDPEIVLADEPTGALDSKTSVQIMELLKEISRDRLVIMVTHNPELAETYSTRIIRLLDGLVTDDTAPYDGGQTDEESDKHAKTDDISGVTEEETPDGEGKEKSAQTPDVPQKGKKKKSAMSVWMAFSLSLKNLLSKGKRTAMVSVAGSIGIIGVSMVLAISSGVRGFIASMEDDLLSGYPLSVEETAIDYEALTSFATTSNKTATPFRLKDKVYVNSLLDTLIGFKGLEVTNTITEDYVNYLESMPKEYYNALQYGYDFDMSNYIYTDFKVTDGELDPALDTSGNYSVSGIRSIYSSVLKQQPKYGKYAGMISTISSFDELPDNSSYILSQYDILATASGKTQKQLSNEEIAEIFESEDSIIMVVSHNAFSDLNFGQYGYMTEDEFLNFAYKSAGDEYDQSVIDKYNGKIKEDGTYDENFQGTDFSFFVGETAKNFTWYPNNTIFTENPLYGTVDGMPPFVYNPSSANFDKSQGTTLKVKAILQKKEGISYGCMSSGLYYTKALSQKTVANGVNSKIAQFINELPTEDADGNEVEQALEVLPYTYSYTYVKDGEWKKANATMAIVSSGNMQSLMTGGLNKVDTSVNAKLIAGSSIPTAFYLYPLDFDSKDLVTDYLDKWNDACGSGAPMEWTDGKGVFHSIMLEEVNKIKYSDNVGLIITMVNTMIEMVTIALVAFTALSLVVSTVMVGIITYVSVVERIKEIGILRAVGARKKDIKRLFNAETFIIGLSAGTVGVVVTYLLSFIINMVVGSLFGVWSICSLPVLNAFIMILISIGLTLVSGLIPASSAAKKDPVVALRTE